MVITREHIVSGDRTLNLSRAMARDGFILTNTQTSSASQGGVRLTTVAHTYTFHDPVQALDAAMSSEGSARMSARDGFFEVVAQSDYQEGGGDEEVILDSFSVSDKYSAEWYLNGSRGGTALVVYRKESTDTAGRGVGPPLTGGISADSVVISGKVITYDGLRTTYRYTFTKASNRRFVRWLR